MLTKTNITYALISIIFFYGSDSHAMLTRLHTLNHAKKINFRNYSIAKENRDFKNVVTQQFTLKNPLSIQTIDTLLSYNRDKYQSIETPYDLSFAGMALAPMTACFIYYPPDFFLLSTLISGFSVFTFFNLKCSLDIRRNMIKILEHGRNTKRLSHPDMMYAEMITREDIRKNINNLSIQPTKQNISHIIQQSTNVGYPWNINNPEILKDTLEGKYNSSDYTLYLQDKE